MVEVLAIILITAMNRVRGGYGGDKIRTVVPFYGTTIGRILYGLSVGLSTVLLGGSLVLSALVVGTVFLGHAVAPFAPFQFMERSNDILIMSLRGLILTGATGIAIMALHSALGGLLFAFSGLLMGPTYKLATLLTPVKLFNDGTVEVNTNETAEILFGLLTSVILILSIVI